MLGCAQENLLLAAAPHSYAYELSLLPNPGNASQIATVLPLTGLAGIWLWQHRPWGYVLARVVLTTMTIVGLSVISGMVFEYGAATRRRP